MNYRERQLRQIIKRDCIPLKQHQELTQEHHNLQFAYQQILLDVDYQLQTHTKQENEQLKQDLVDWNERYQDLETNLNEQATQANQNLKKSKEQNHQTQSAYLQKINDLETALFNLAKQKLKGKKEASELLNQLETNWKQNQATWTHEKQTLTNELTQQKQAYGDLILANKQQIQAKETKINELENWSAGQHKRILDLEKQAQATEQAREQSQQDLNLSQQENQNLSQQIRQGQVREAELNKIVQASQTKLANTEQTLKATESQLKQTQQKAQQDQQTKQEIINTLRTEKQESQTKITNLSQANTNQTKTIADQLSQINQKDTKLAKQKQVLEQLLANREQRLNELGEQND